MATPTTTTTATPATTTTTPAVTGAATAGTTSTGLSSAPSTISSCATSTESKGCCATIRACITSVINAIRDCLAKLPLIGSFFKRETTDSTTTTTTTTTTTAATVTDADLTAMIKAVFPETVAAGATVASPARDVLDNAKGQFILIQDKRARMQAFNVVMKGANSTSDIVKEFYDILPVDDQNAFKGHMHTVNGGDSGHGFGFGEYMVHNQIRSVVAKQAVDNYIAALAPVAGTTTSITTATTI